MSGSFQPDQQQYLQLPGSGGPFDQKFSSTSGPAQQVQILNGMAQPGAGIYNINGLDSRLADTATEDEPEEAIVQPTCQVVQSSG